MPGRHPWLLEELYYKYISPAADEQTKKITEAARSKRALDNCMKKIRLQMAVLYDYFAYVEDNIPEFLSLPDDMFFGKLFPYDAASYLLESIAPSILQKYEKYYPKHFWDDKNIQASKKEKSIQARYLKPAHKNSQNGTLS